MRYFELCTDYSVMVENIPKNATNKEEWVNFFKTLGPLADHGGQVADVTIALNNGMIFMAELNLF